MQNRLKQSMFAGPDAHEAKVRGYSAVVLRDVFRDIGYADQDVLSERICGGMPWGCGPIRSSRILRFYSVNSPCNHYK